MSIRRGGARDESAQVEHLLGYGVDHRRRSAVARGFRRSWYVPDLVSNPRRGRCGIHIHFLQEPRPLLVGSDPRVWPSSRDGVGPARACFPRGGERSAVLGRGRRGLLGGLSGSRSRALVGADRGWTLPIFRTFGGSGRKPRPHG